MNTQRIILSTTILFLFLACKKDEDSSPAVEAQCPDKPGIKITIADSSFQMLPNFNEKTLIFRDSLGNEMTFDVIGMNNPKNLQYHRYEECKLDKSKAVKVIDLIESKTIHWVAQEDENFSMRLVLRIGYFWENPELIYDYLDALITCGRTGSKLNLLVNRRDLHDNYVRNFQRPFSSLDILDKTFTQVYVSSDRNLYFTKELGVVAFRDEAAKHWVLVD